MRRVVFTTAGTGSLGCTDAALYCLFPVHAAPQVQIDETGNETPAMQGDGLRRFGRADNRRSLYRDARAAFSVVITVANGPPPPARYR